MSGEFNRSELNGSALRTSNDDSAPGSPIVTSATPIAATPGAGVVPKNVEDVVYSDVGVNTLLNRLKQSIASARDFAAFLKKRSTLEEEQAAGLKRLARSQSEILGRSEVKMGSYAVQLGELMRLHDRMADNGMQFALSLHQMHEDLNDLATNLERGRKQWKHEGLSAEKRAADAESAMHKSKSRYDTLAEDYDRARTGDTKGSRRIGLKGPKSAEQYESDLLRKTQQADQDYEERVKHAKSQRDTLTNTDRPKAVKALMELIKECDSALTLQLQKFATFNEKLLLGNGLAVTPLTDKNAPGSQKSMRDIVLDIDNDNDFNNFVRTQNIPPRPSEIKYEKHPTFLPKTQNPFPSQQDRQISSAWGQQPPPQSSQGAPPPPSFNTNPGSASPVQAGSMNSRFDYLGGPPQRPSGEQDPRPSSAKGFAQQTSPPPMPPQTQSPSNYVDRYNPMGGPTSYSGGAAAAPPYPTHPADRSAGGYQAPQHKQTTGSIPGPPAGAAIRPYPPPPSSQHTLPPLRPVFGVSLDDLFTRDQTAVPQLVVQCILAVDTFGLDVEGIYRQSGTASHIGTLKSQFDHDSSRIDFRNPTNFMHDVNSVASLLKQFFKDLPDPLFTLQQYPHFIEAAKIDSDEQRRDALHQNINDLPDPNYATLRALVLHLHRVMMNESRNRMGSSQLAVCFAPSLMGTIGGQIADAGLQARVLDTILVNATAIFDDD